MIEPAYSATINEFFSDWENAVFCNKIARKAAQSETVSWENNGQAIYKLLIDSKVNRESYIAFEIPCPRSNQRIDCMILGKGKDNKSHILILELKQWSNLTVTKVPNIAVFQENIVRAQVGERICRNHCHPSDQALGYREELLGSMPVFEEDINLHCCSYCYNYNRNANNNVLADSQYASLCEKSPFYDKTNSSELKEFVEDLFSQGFGKDVLDEFKKAEIRPTHMLMDAVAHMFDENNEYDFVLQNEQRPAAQTILDAIEESKKDKQKRVIVVKGGPGTGKTLIALNVLSRLARNDKDLNIRFATRSSALRDTLKEKLRHSNNNNGISPAGLISNTIFEFYPLGTKNKGYTENKIDVLMIDEAHRTEKSANSMGTGTNTYFSQAMSLIYSSKVTVFFIDDKQVVSNNEIGRSSDIESAARLYGNNQAEAERAEFKKTKLDKEKNESRKSKLQKIYDDIIEINSQAPDCLTIQLYSQFRCNGSDGYIDWIDSILYPDSDDINKNATLGTSYKFGVCDTPGKLEMKIRSLNVPYFAPKSEVPRGVEKKADKKKDEVIARLVAGYCWKWSDKLQKNDGNGENLIYDVVISAKDCGREENWEWKMPWETKQRQASGIYAEWYAPSAELWASHPCGINQVGCVPSAQGFEFDYAGVILGPDIVYRDGKIKTVAGLTNGKVNGPNSDILIRNIYRVLMTRGRKGCYIFCYDKALNDYFKKITAGTN